VPEPYRRPGRAASMPARAAMSRPDRARSTKFPHWVALSSLGLVLWLYYGNTVPALHERDQLEALQGDLADLRARYDAAIRDARLGRALNADVDLQALFLAIDRRGYTPAELCAAHPATEAAGGNAAKDR